MQPFIVKLNGPASGRTAFNWKADKEFFEQFGNPDILDAEVEVQARVVDHGATVDVRCTMAGTVVVPCDRCLDDLELEVATDFEETYTPDSDELDLSQDVYDYVCTALPLQRVHPEGQCNPETVKYLSK
ncbi:MAG: DUF177 domain-containing protein [Bacteroidales bacterium]|nr:DUF177 domain-containing protein [Bacteroidales bacterium]